MFRFIPPKVDTLDETSDLAKFCPPAKVVLGDAVDLFKGGSREVNDGRLQSISRNVTLVEGFL